MEEYSGTVAVVPCVSVPYHLLVRVHSARCLCPWCAIFGGRAMPVKSNLHGQPALSLGDGRKTWALPQALWVGAGTSRRLVRPRGAPSFLSLFSPPSGNALDPPPPPGDASRQRDWSIPSPPTTCAIRAARSGSLSEVGRALDLQSPRLWPLPVSDSRSSRKTTVFAWRDVGGVTSGRQQQRGKYPSLWK